MTYCIFKLKCSPILLTGYFYIYELRTQSLRPELVFLSNTVFQLNN